eukprot:458748_1
MNDNKLSFWGWGEKIPPKLSSAVETSSSRFHRTFNIDPKKDLFPIPSLDNISLQSPRFKIDTNSKLKDIIISSNKKDRIQHTYGRSSKDYIRMIMEDYSIAPDYVAFPKTNKQIELILNYCTNNNIAVVTYGGGTSVVGGVETNLYFAYNGVISIDLTTMNKIIIVNEMDQTITVQPGLTCMNLENYLKINHPQYTLRHFPQSFEFASIGGVIVTRSGGHFAVGKTRIDHFLQSAKLITPTKGIISTPNIPSSGSGLEVNGCIIKGNEGIFGIVTDITLKLLRKPKYKRNVKIEFNGMTFIEAAQYIREFVQCGLEPSNCRLIDSMESFSNGLSTNPAIHVCIVGFESHLNKDFENEINAVSNIINKLNHKYNGNAAAVIKSDSNTNTNSKPDRNNAVGNWYFSFLSAPYTRDEFLRTGIFIDTFETCIKWSLLGQLHDNIYITVKESIEKLFYKNCVYFLTKRFTHVYSDGVSIYFTLVIDPRREWKKKYNNYKDYLSEMYSAWCELKNNIQECVVSNIGSSTHHHAVGKDHAQSFVKEVGIPNIEWMISLKKYFDPNWILNPGVLIPYVPYKSLMERKNIYGNKKVIHMDDVDGYCPKDFIRTFIPSKL